MLGRIRRNAESITINGTGIQGVTAASFNYESVAGSPLSSLGIDRIRYAPQGPQTANLQLSIALGSINRLYVLINKKQITEQETMALLIKTAKEIRKLEDRI